MLYLYSDVCHTTIRGISFWNALFEGNISQFYNYPYPGVEGSWLPHGTMEGAYDLGLYIIFALWDFPLWCFEKITGISFLSSSLTVNSIVIMGGYDIISVLFTLLGLYFYLKDEEWKFILSFVIAVTCKMFALFIVVPLILLKYKELGKVLKKVLIGISFIAIPKLVVLLGNLINKIATLQNVSSQNASAAVITSNDVIAHSNIINEQMFAGNGAVISFSQIPIFFVATFAFWWICWKKKDVTKYEVLYYSLIAMSIFSLCVRLNTYWIILLVPYVIIIMGINADKFLDNVILEVLLSVSYVIYQAYILFWCYSYNLVNKMFGIYPSNDKEYVYCLVPRFIDNLAEKIGISPENICSLFMGAFATGLILFVYDNRPARLKEAEIDYTVIRKYSWFRIVPAIGVAIIPVAAVLFF